jgi:signal transduction histidine kinase
MWVRKRCRWSLRIRLVAVVLLALLPIAALLAFLWHGARERDREDALDNLTQTSEAVAVIADTVFDEGITLGLSIATDPAVQSLDPVRFVPRLREIHTLVPHYTNIIVVDADGTILGWTDPEPPAAGKASVAQRSFFQRLKASGQPTTIHVVDDQGPSAIGIGVAVPIVAADGSLAGTVAIVFDQNHISQRLGQVRPFSGQEFALIDPTGRIALFVGQHAPLAGRLTWEQRDRSQVPEVQQALAGQISTSSTFRGTFTGQERLAALTPTPRHGWVVFSTWTAAQALGPTRQAEQRELTIFVAIVLVILIGAVVASRSLIAPLRRLAEHASRLDDGHFERIDGPTPNNEIGDLTASFNTMGERLQRTIDKLRQERARLATVLHHLPVGAVIRSAPSGRLILGNAQAERIWRHPFVSGAEFNPTAPGQSLHQDGRPYTRDEWPIFRSMTTGEEVRDEELAVRRGDGTDGILVMSSAPIRDEDGEIVAAVSTFDDITERRQTEARLREREEMLRALVDQFPGAVALFDRDLRYVLAAGRRLMDIDVAPELLVGRRLVDVFPPGQIEASAPYHQRALGGEAVTFDTTVAGRTFRVTMTPIFDAAGAVEHVLSVTFDVTEERAQFDQAVRDEKLRALGQMASGIAHNLNQTLALVTGYSEMARTALIQSPPDLTELRRMLSIIERAAYDGGDTVKRLLTVARGQGDRPHQSIDVAELLHEVEQLTAPRWRARPSAEGGPVDLRVQVEPGAVVVGSRAGLREVLTNLVLNALDAMPQGGTITLSARLSANRMLIEVADTGSGMSPEVQRQIFEPFFTTKGERGTGLGLAMVFGIVRRHGGEIDVTSESGRGTTFHLSLPAGVAEKPAAPTPPKTCAARSLRVLVVDDEAKLAALAAGMLRHDGHHAIETGSGLEALERLRAEPFDLLISDQ